MRTPRRRPPVPSARPVHLAETAAYGLLRFSLPLFPNASAEFAPIAMWLGVIGIFLRRVDGLYPIRHQASDLLIPPFYMGFVLIAIYTGSQLAYRGALIQMIAHGLSAAGLFGILCGRLYERLHTRDAYAYDGRPVGQMKWFACCPCSLR